MSEYALSFLLGSERRYQSTFIVYRLLGYLSILRELFGRTTGSFISPAVSLPHFPGGVISDRDLPKPGLNIPGLNAESRLGSPV